jgi:hypothetical protein
MNPLFQALTGGAGLPGQNPMPAAGTSAGAFQGVLGRAQQLAAMFQNPQQIVQRYFPDAPAEVAGDPEQLVGWLQRTGKVNPQMVQMARQMMGR